MSLDRSLKTASGLARHRNVLTRDERIARLTEGKKFDPATNSPIGLVKVGNRKIVAAAKPKKEAVEGEAGAAGAAAPAAAAAPAGKGAAGGKGAAPAAAGKGAAASGGSGGAKGAAPAGKGAKGGKGK